MEARSKACVVAVPRAEPSVELGGDRREDVRAEREHGPDELLVERPHRERE